MNKALLVSSIIALVAIAVFYFVSKTIFIVIVFIPAVILSFILYLKTYYTRFPSSDSILTLYLLALGIQFLHFTEEYLTNFVTIVPALFGRDPFPQDYFVVFNMVAYFFFTLGAIAVNKGSKEFMIIPLFFVLVATVINPIGHILAAIYTGGYFTGLITAIAYLFVGPRLLRQILKAN